MIIAAIARPDRAANEADVVKEFSALSERCDVHRDCERQHHKAPGEGPDGGGETGRRALTEKIFKAINRFGAQR